MLASSGPKFELLWSHELAKVAYVSQRYRARFDLDAFLLSLLDDHLPQLVGGTF